jgi:hypothetical protein
MASHPTKKDIYGPGTFTDVDFTPVPQECTRILHHLADTTPGFTTDPAILDIVHFHGADYLFGILTPLYIYLLTCF